MFNLFKKKSSNEELIAILIISLGETFLKKRLYYILPEEGTINPNVSHINNGYCRQFAFELRNVLSEHKINSEYCEKKYKGIPHAFIKIDNLFYDSETLYGVSSWKKLPVFK